MGRVPVAVLVLLAASLTACVPAAVPTPAPTAEPWVRSTNAQYGLTLRHPAGWLSNGRYFAAAPRIDGPDGFVQLIGVAGPGAGQAIEDVARAWIAHTLHPWGTGASVRSLLVDGQAAALVWPSDDQPLAPGEAPHAVAFVVNANRGGQTLWIGADTAHIRAILASVRFTNP
jgi:hypothetical protein